MASSSSEQSRKPFLTVGDILTDDHIHWEFEIHSSKEDNDACPLLGGNGETAKDDTPGELKQSSEIEKRSRIASVVPMAPELSVRTGVPQRSEDQQCVPAGAQKFKSVPRTQEEPKFSDVVLSTEQNKLPAEEKEMPDNEDLEVEAIIARVTEMSSSLDDAIVELSSVSSEEATSRGFDMCSSPSIQFTQRVAIACKNLRSACNDLIVTCAEESTCLLQFAAAHPEHASLCYKLSSIYFVLSAFSSQFYSAVHEVSQTFSKLPNFSYRTETLSNDLVKTISEATVACQVLAIDSKDMYSSFLKNITSTQSQSPSYSSPEKSEAVEETAVDSESDDEEFGIKISQLNFISSQISMAMGQLQTSHQLLQEVECQGKPQCSGHLSSESSSPPSLFPTEDGFVRISVEILSVERKVMSVIKTIKAIQNSKKINRGN